MTKIRLTGGAGRRFLTGLFAALIGASLVASEAVAQPPQRGGRDGGGRQGRDQGRDQGRGPSRDQGRGGRPGGDRGGERGGWGGPGGGDQGARQGGPGEGQNGGQGNENKPEQPKPDPQVNLEEALKNSLGNVPIRLNQNNFISQDGLKLYGTYYKGRGDKDTPVVVILPGLSRTRSDEHITALAGLLANKGVAVLIPDIRGRGESVRQRQNGPGAPWQQGGSDQNRQDDPNAKPSNSDISKMIDADRTVWFKFLIDVHNQGYCNVKKTILVGSEFSAALAAAWAKSDWSGKGSAYQNVVGVVLLSPDAVDTKDKKKKSKDEEAAPAAEKYDALNSLEAVRKLAKGKGTFGYLLLCGGLNAEKLKDAQLIQQKVGGKADEDAKANEKLVLLVNFQTEKQGEDFYEIESLGAPKIIADFVDKRMKELPTKRTRWQEIDLKKSR